MTPSRIAAAHLSQASGPFTPEQARNLLEERSARAAGKRDLCIMACVFCKDPQFRNWMQELAGDGMYVSEPAAKAFITSLCRVTSRTALDTDPAAATRFHDLIRLPFLAWKEAQHG